MISHVKSTFKISIFIILIVLIFYTMSISAAINIQESAELNQENPIQPGETVEIQYSVSNVGDQEYSGEIDLELLETPPWDIINMYGDGAIKCTEGSDGTWATEGTNPACYRGWDTLEVGEEWNPKIMFKVPSDADGEYTILATLSHGEGSQNFRTTIQVDGEENSAGGNSPEINTPSFACDDDCTVLLVFTGFISTTLLTGYLILRQQRTDHHG